MKDKHSVIFQAATLGVELSEIHKSRVRLQELWSAAHDKKRLSLTVYGDAGLYTFTMDTDHFRPAMINAAESLKLRAEETLAKLRKVLEQDYEYAEHDAPLPEDDE